MRAKLTAATGLLVAACLLLAAAPVAVLGCTGAGFYVAPQATRAAAPDAQEALSREGMVQYLDALDTIEDYRQNVKSTFSCVDSRGLTDELGTPGGDFAELATAIVAYYNVSGITKVELQDIDDIFRSFMAKVITKERPFYYHTSDEKLHKVFKYLEENKHITPAPVVLPEHAPANTELREAWLRALSMAHHQGCGHVRLMMEKYKEYGMLTDDIPKDLVKSMYRYFWNTSKHSEERAKISFQIVQGPLAGHAVAILESKGDCQGWSPALPPAHGGTQAFILHTKAADDFRDSVIKPFFAQYAASKGRQLNQAAFMRKLRDLHSLALGNTLTFLEPLNKVPIWAVTVQTKS